MGWLESISRYPPDRFEACETHCGSSRLDRPFAGSVALAVPRVFPEASTAVTCTVAAPPGPATTSVVWTWALWVTMGTIECRGNSRDNGKDARYFAVGKLSPNWIS